jgi:hypothetical protein
MEYLLRNDVTSTMIIYNGGISDLAYELGFRVACNGVKVTESQIANLKAMGYNLTDELPKDEEV